MGVVYRAHDPVIGRDVAVKTLHLSEAGTGMSREELVGRFQTEARAAGLLAHPNIVVVYDAGEEGGMFYITMELVEGRSLQSMLDARQLFPLPRVMKLMEQVCSALDFAHQRNVVHRDIKPANLMLTADDTVKITDFGTAKILQFGTAQTSHVMGTPSYMSPEQVKGKPVDGRSDIFSLGVILYELMTGEKPFPGQNITTVIYKIINEDPIPPRSLDSSIHPGLSAVITRALAKEPTARYQNCQELLDAMKNYHDIVSPEATVRMSPVTASAAGAGAPASASPLRPSSISSNARPHAGDTPMRPAPSFGGNDRRTSSRSGSILLTLLLLGVIGYASYRIWPQMLDIWERLHEPGEALAPRAKALPVIPPANSGTPDARPDDSLKTPPVGEKTAPVTAEASPPRAQAPAPKAIAKPAEAVEAPAPRAMEKLAVPGKLAAPTATPAANSLKSTLESELAKLSLADKVKVQATGNALTVSGRLTPREHGELLNRLHNVPAGVRVVDNIEYTDELKETVKATVTSRPAGANIVVNDKPEPMQTPATISLDPGTYRISVSKEGFQPYTGELIVKAGKPAQVDVELAPAPSDAGWVWVRSAPPGAEIFVDGADLRLRTPSRVEMSKGEHEVWLTYKGFTSAHRMFQVEPGQNMEFTESFEQQ
jgi:serine/threonine protein kinase